MKILNVIVVISILFLSYVMIDNGTGVKNYDTMLLSLVTMIVILIIYLILSLEIRRNKRN